MSKIAFVGGLSKVLQPFKEIIGRIAGILAVAQHFSGIFICLNIKKKGNTTDTSSVPFVGSIMMALALLKYSMLIEDKVMFQVNIAALLLNIIYSAFYYSYSTDKWNEILKPLAISVGIAGVMWGYSEWEDPLVIADRYGLILTVFMLGLLGSPLSDMKNIIEKKDASNIPFVMILMGALVTFSWLLYSIILENDFLLLQNILGFIICSVQLVLIYLYPGLQRSEEGTELAQ